MRPVLRGDSPQPTDYDNYEHAFPELAARLGRYCSYCERRIATSLAVEHIQPKGLKKYRQFIGRWENFLLGCVNCNSTKGKQDVLLTDLLLPDRDNTAAAYDYPMDGTVRVRANIPENIQQFAAATLTLTGLDKPVSKVKDSNGKLVAVDRVSQRKKPGSWRERV